jgi:hypothetical protein
MLARFAAYVWTRLVRIRGNCLILDSYTPKSENLSLTFILPTMVTKNVIAPRHQSRIRKTLIYFSEPWRPLPFDSAAQGGEFIESRLCARHVFPTSSSSPKFQISLASFQSSRSGRNTLSAYHSQRLAQAVEDMIGTDDVGQAMAVQIGLQGRLRVCEHQHNAVAGQVFV